MRRLGIVAAFAFVLANISAGGVGAQIVLPEDRIHPEIDIHIRGFQIFYDYEATGTNDRTGRWPAGFIASPNPTSVTPIRFGAGPETYWVRNLINNDPVTHHIVQCSGGQQDASECTIVPDARFRQTSANEVHRFDDFPDGMIILTCQIHRGMRAEIFKYRFCHPYCND